MTKHAPKDRNAAPPDSGAGAPGRMSGDKDVLITVRRSVFISGAAKALLASDDLPESFSILSESRARYIAMCIFEHVQNAADEGN